MQIIIIGSGECNFARSLTRRVMAELATLSMRADGPSHVSVK